MIKRRKYFSFLILLLVCFDSYRTFVCVIAGIYFESSDNSFCTSSTMSTMGVIVSGRLVRHSTIQFRRKFQHYIHCFSPKQIFNK